MGSIQHVILSRVSGCGFIEEGRIRLHETTLEGGVENNEQRREGKGGSFTV